MRFRVWESTLMTGPHRTELLFSFLTFKLSAKGVVAILLAVPVAVILLVVAYRIATLDVSNWKITRGTATAELSCLEP